MRDDTERKIQDELEQVRAKLGERDSDHRGIKEALQRLIAVVTEMPHRRDIARLEGNQAEIKEQNRLIRERQQEIVSMLRNIALRGIGIIVTAVTAIAAGIKESELFRSILDRFL